MKSSKGSRTKKSTANLEVPGILAFLNGKGGVGKSTGSVHALDWFHQRGSSVILVDADIQLSSSEWATELELPFQVILNPEELFEKLPKLRQDYELVIVDGPAKSNEVTKAILARCDLALIPCRESILELRSSGGAAGILTLVNHVRELRGNLPKAAVYMSQVKKGTRLLGEAQEALGEEGGVPLLESVIYDHQVFKDAPGQAATVFRMTTGSTAKTAKTAAKLYEALFTEALRIFNDD